LTKKVPLIHSTRKEFLSSILQDGLLARSDFDTLNLKMRENVVYCLLKKEDNKMWSSNPKYIDLLVWVEPNRCLVADMDLIGLA